MSVAFFFYPQSFVSCEDIYFFYWVTAASNVAYTTTLLWNYTVWFNSFKEVNGNKIFYFVFAAFQKIASDLLC